MSGTWPEALFIANCVIYFTDRDGRSELVALTSLCFDDCKHKSCFEHFKPEITCYQNFF